METYKITFIGHREFYHHRTLEEKLPKLLRQYLSSHEYVEFYIGRSGEFDIAVASIVKQLQKDLGTHNNRLILVLPYPVKNIDEHEKYYDKVLLPLPSTTHYKRAITARNEWLVDNCDLLIAYTERETGGAYATCKYARKTGKPVVQLAPLV